MTRSTGTATPGRDSAASTDCSVASTQDARLRQINSARTRAAPGNAEGSRSSSSETVSGPTAECQHPVDSVKKWRAVRRGWTSPGSDPRDVVRDQVATPTGAPTCSCSRTAGDGACAIAHVVVRSTNGHLVIVLEDGRRSTCLCIGLTAGRNALPVIELLSDQLPLYTSYPTAARPTCENGTIEQSTGDHHPTHIRSRAASAAVLRRCDEGPTTGQQIVRPSYFRSLPPPEPGAVSVERAAMNASCGTSTRPTIFIRFLPSFCFSSSLRFRVMSPP